MTSRSYAAAATAEMTVGNRFERSLSVVVAVAAVVMAATVVYRDFGSSRTPRGSSSNDVTPQLYPGWTDLLAAGHTWGEASARAKLIEFSDLECPYCRDFHNKTLPPLLSRFGPDLSITFVHYPLTAHRFAAPAARAAECAGVQGHFREFVEQTFKKQDSLGLRTWSAFATDAGVSDSAAFARCIAKPAAGIVDSGLAAGHRIGIRGTPTIVLNGWRYAFPPTTEELEKLVSAAIAGTGQFANR